MSSSTLKYNGDFYFSNHSAKYNPSLSFYRRIIISVFRIELSKEHKYINSCSLFDFAGDNIGLADLIGQTLQNRPAIHTLKTECRKCLSILFVLTMLHFLYFFLPLSHRCIKEPSLRNVYLVVILNAEIFMNQEEKPVCLALKCA